MSRELQNFFTQDQVMKILRDEAIFSATDHSRTRAVNQLVQRYGVEALPVINDILNSLVVSDREFKRFCLAVIERITTE